MLADPAAVVLHLVKRGHGCCNGCFAALHHWHDMTKLSPVKQAADSGRRPDRSGVIGAFRLYGIWLLI
jgi:hypothetical protein